MDLKLRGIRAVTTEISEHRVAQKSLQASEQMLIDIFARLPDGISVQDANLNIVWVNPAMERWFADSAPLVGKKCYETYRNAEFPCTTCPSQKSIETRQPAHETISITASGGEITRWLELHSFPLVDRATGQLNGTVEYFRDVTEPKKEEEAFHAALARLEGLINATPDFVVFKDVEGRFLQVNRAAEEFLGFPKEEIEGKRSSELLPPYLAEAMADGDERFRRDGQSVRGEQFVTRPEGVTHWYDTIKFPVFDQTGQLSGVGGISRDITQIKTIELELRASESRNRLVLDESPLGIAVVQDGRLVYVNPALRILLGYESLDRLVGKPVVDLVVPEDRATIYQELVATSGGKSVLSHFEVRLLKEDGVPVDLDLWPKETYYGGLPALLAFVVDLTESKALLEQAVQARKMEAVETLAAGIAHEFNNLLTVASGFTELLLSGKQEGDPDYSDLLTIAVSCARGVDLVRKPRLLGRRADNYFQALDLNSELVETMGLLSRKLPENISLEVRMDDCQRKIWADSGQIAQIVVNLLMNAADSMPEGGRLLIKTTHISVDEEYCKTHRWSKFGEYVEFTVSDTGHGMDKETVSRIFEPFFTTRRLANNSGLGLSVVHGIVQEHGGHVACESEVGRGTTFKVYFPALSDPQQLECLPEPPESRGGTETILLVDDQQDIQDMGKRFLSQFGCTVLCAADGLEALQVFREVGSEISLVILDLVMPEMGGRQCLEEILKLDPKTKVIVASGYSTRQEVKETVQMGAKGVISKPFTTRQLLKVVRQTLDGPAD